MHTNSIIMLVDDSLDDLELMRIAFKRAGIRNPIAEMHSGEEAIEYLSGEGKYADRRHFPLPCVVITDLKMPGVDGFELLEWLKGQSAFDRVPKIVLTASRHDEDERRATEVGCSAYFVKPEQLDGLVKLVSKMNDGWISVYCPIAAS
jgi:Response regulator containing CheY-like receiver, AAA-type ATPase, and DNA-binding domains